MAEEEDKTEEQQAEEQKAKELEELKQKKQELESKIRQRESPKPIPLGKIFAVVFVAALVGSFGGVSLGGLTAPTTGEIVQETSSTTTPTQQRPPAPSGTVKMAELVDDDPFLGDENAPVTFVEFSDGQCPFCRRQYTQTLPQLKRDYIDTGKVKYVYQHFPLSFHPAAQPSAEAIECAEDQGKFWELHDKIFDEQNKQGTGTVQFSVDDIKTWAGEIGLDTQSFNGCLDSGKYRSEVQADFAAGQQAGVTGTPTSFIGPSDGFGQKIVGAQSYAVLKAAIDSYL